MKKCLPTVLLTVTQATDAFEVSWDLSDPALDGGIPGAGLATYTVEVCTNSPTACEPLIPNPGTSGTFLYDGASEHSYLFRVWAKDNETTEESVQNTAAITKYYLFGGQRVAMRVGTGDQSAVYFLHGDHPSRPFRTGSGRVSMTTNALGEIVCQMR